MFQFIHPQSAKPNYTTGQTWGALKKAWRGYKIAKVQSDTAKMTEYAKKLERSNMIWELNKQNSQN